MAYVLLLDQVVTQARMRWSAEAAAGAEKLSDPADAVTEFHRQLQAPLNVEQIRERVLRAVASA